jgi:hypothetical protein
MRCAARTGLYRRWPCTRSAGPCRGCNAHHQHQAWGPWNRAGTRTGGFIWMKGGSIAKLLPAANLRSDPIRAERPVRWLTHTTRESRCTTPRACCPMPNASPTNPSPSPQAQADKPQAVMPCRCKAGFAVSHTRHGLTGLAATSWFQTKKCCTPPRCQLPTSELPPTGAAHPEGRGLHPAPPPALPRCP